jgi:hypothetical protein
MQTNYLKFRECGMNAAHAYRSAKTLTAWQESEASGRVRITAEQEQESYFSVYGEPDNAREREQITETLERWGCVYVLAEYLSPSGEWEHGDAIGMCVYENPLSPFENWYVPDLMSETLDRLETAWTEAATVV